MPTLQFLRVDHCAAEDRLKLILAFFVAFEFVQGYDQDEWDSDFDDNDDQQAMPPPSGETLWLLDVHSALINKKEPKILCPS